jgi:predicted RNase H-like nuclease (RuvC/YqgF family)
MNILEKIEDFLKYSLREKGYKEKIKALEKEIDDIKAENKECKKEIYSIKTENDKYKEQLEIIKKLKIVRQATFLVDFIELRAFSIERNLDNEQEKTIIGYINKNDEVKEWCLSCSLETHENLCESFKKQVLMENSKKIEDI